MRRSTRTSAGDSARCFAANSYKTSGDSAFYPAWAARIVGDHKLHAQAGQVEVEIRYDEFRLRVRDDGKGIDQAVLAAQGIEGHYGLRGMPERAALIIGKLPVWSEVGVGTEVELRIQASAVYATARRRSWWSRLSGSGIPAQERGDAS